MTVTQILLQWGDGDEKALDRLFPLVYDELKRLAHGRLRGERPGHTLNTTALVHEAYIKLVDVNRIDWQDRAHFLAVASRMMRRVLVDYARKRNAVKRGGDRQRVDFEEEALISDDYAHTLLELDDVLARLEQAHPRQAQAVELRYFGGLTLEEAGGVLEISPATVMRDLRFAEAWIARAWYGSLGVLKDAK